MRTDAYTATVMLPCGSARPASEAAAPGAASVAGVSSGVALGSTTAKRYVSGGEAVLQPAVLSVNTGLKAAPLDGLTTSVPLEGGVAVVTSTDAFACRWLLAAVAVSVNSSAAPAGSAAGGSTSDASAQVTAGSAAKPTAGGAYPCAACTLHAQLSGSSPLTDATPSTSFRAGSSSGAGAGASRTAGGAVAGVAKHRAAPSASSASSGAPLTAPARPARHRGSQLHGQVQAKCAHTHWDLHWDCYTTCCMHRVRRRAHLYVCAASPRRQGSFGCA